MTSYPVALRGFSPADIARLCELAGDWEVAKMTASIPHPYTPEIATSFIAGQDAAASRGEAWTYAITRAGDDALVGCVTLMDDPEPRGNLGYWIGQPYWGMGYASAAVRALLAVGFAQLPHMKLTALHLASNPASGRVLARCGMVEGERVTLPHRDAGPQEFCTWSITRNALARHRDEPC